MQRGQCEIETKHVVWLPFLRYAVICYFDASPVRPLPAGFYVCACCGPHKPTHEHTESLASCSPDVAPGSSPVCCIVCCHYPVGLSLPRSVNIYVLPALVLALNATLSSSASGAGPATWQHGNIIVKGSNGTQTFSSDWPSGCLASTRFSWLPVVHFPILRTFHLSLLEQKSNC